MRAPCRMRSFIQWFCLLVVAVPALAMAAATQPAEAVASRVAGLASELKPDIPAEEGIRICDQLRELGPAAAPAAPELISLLARGGPIHGHAWEALHRIGPAAVTDLRRGLEDSSANVRFGCAVLLTDMGPAAREAADEVVRLMEKGDDSSTQLAAMIAEGIGPAAAKAIPYLVKAIGIDQSGVRDSALNALRAVDPDAPAELYPAVVDLSKAWRESAALKTLGDLGPRAADALPVLLHSPIAVSRAPRVWLQFAKTLDRLGPPTKLGALAILDQLDKNPDDAEFRAVAARVLAKGGPGVLAPLPIYRIAMFLRDERLSEVALEVFGKQGAHAQTASADLSVLLLDGPAVRARAVSVIGDIGPEAHMIPELTRAVRDDDAAVRAAAAEALAKMGHAAGLAAPAILAALQSYRIPAAVGARALRAAGKADPKAEPLLLERLKSDDVSIRQESAAALAALFPQSRSAAEALIAAVKAKDWAVRENLAPGLSHSPLKDSLLVPVLQKLTSDEDEMVRINARCALRDLGATVSQVQSH